MHMWLNPVELTLDRSCLGHLTKSANSRFCVSSFQVVCKLRSPEVVSCKAEGLVRECDFLKDEHLYALRRLQTHIGRLGEGRQKI